jgi:hypothetical protein
MEMQQRILALAADLGADPREIAAAIQVMQSGRADLIVELLAARMNVRAALAKSKNRCAFDGNGDGR